MWYVIWTITGREERCRQMIQRFCDSSTYERCVVAYKRMRKLIKGKWEVQEEKFAPSYLFVESNTVEEFAEELKKVIGFSELLRSDEVFVPLHEKEAALLQSLIGDGEVISESFGVKEGDRVTVLEGSLVGLEGMIKYIDRHKRIAVIEMEFFHQITEMKLSLELVTPAQLREGAVKQKEEVSQEEFKNWQNSTVF